MIRIVFKTDGSVCSTAQSVAEAMVIAAISPDETEVHPDDLLAAQKAEAEALVVAQADDYGSRLTAGYPRHECESWPVKIVEARVILAGETDPDNFPIIASECQFTGTSYAVTAASILAKAAPFAKASGAISGIRQETIRQINAAENKAEIAAALGWAKAAADAAFASI